MKILYVGPLSIPLVDILSGKNESEITGFPAYFYPVYKLIKQGHTVDFATVSSIKDYNIVVDWFHEKQIVSNIYQDPELIGKMSSARRKIYILGLWLKHCKEINRLIKNKKYDFVYCQEILGTFGNVIAAIHNIPCGMRIYGDTFAYKSHIMTKYEYIKKHGKYSLFFHKPLLLLTYKLKKSFILTTADGTHGDLTYRLLRPKKKKYEFFYWTTGVDKSTPYIDDEFKIGITQNPFICYPARIDSIKRQDKAIEVLSILHKKGLKIHLYLIGQICDNAYYTKLKNLINKMKLQDYVHFTGGVSQSDVKRYALLSVAAVLTSDSSNRGNVFFEIFSTGVPVISFNDGSLNGYINSNNNGFLVNSLNEMADTVAELMQNSTKRLEISRNAIKTAKDKVLSIDKRFDLEVNLISLCAKHRPIDDIPQTI